MGNLLKYEWYGLRHNPVFWLIMAVSCVFGILMFGPDSLENTPMVPGIPYDLQGIFMSITADGSCPILIIAGAFTAMLLGQRFSDRTIDHEITAGHSRISIYASQCMVGLIVPNTALLLALLAGCLRCSLSVPLPSVETIPYFIRTVGMLSILGFSLVSACVFFVVLFRDTSKSMAISALFLLVACWMMAALLQTSAIVPGTVYTDTPGLALLLHPAYLIRYILQTNLSLAQGVEAMSVAVGWSTLFLCSGYYIFRRYEQR